MQFSAVMKKKTIDKIYLPYYFSFNFILRLSDGQNMIIILLGVIDWCRIIVIATICSTELSSSRRNPWFYQLRWQRGPIPQMGLVKFGPGWLNGIWNWVLWMLMFFIWAHSPVSWVHCWPPWRALISKLKYLCCQNRAQWRWTNPLRFYGSSGIGPIMAKWNLGSMRAFVLRMGTFSSQLGSQRGPWRALISKLKYCCSQNRALWRFLNPMGPGALGTKSFFMASQSHIVCF